MNRSFSAPGVRGSGVPTCSVAMCQRTEEKTRMVMAWRKVHLGCWRPNPRRKVTRYTGRREISKPMAQIAYTPLRGCCVRFTMADRRAWWHSWILETTISRRLCGSSTARSYGDTERRSTVQGMTGECCRDHSPFVVNICLERPGLVRGT